MKFQDWSIPLVLVALCIVNIGLKVERNQSIEQRDAARQEARQIAGMYNGLLIGRGCGLPE
ncbi:hypothetical protein [Pseudomonas asiatica]|uniref:hypothetical protein n=1 Tax=Pseudomonas asiatica TaxID=2219225 RepID=UPI0018AC1FEB|nr:hypothetical protein [Pseudomonas asiatica]MBF8802236.1 hypothetical protein [Pseudomonas asiatica]